MTTLPPVMATAICVFSGMLIVSAGYLLWRWTIGHKWSYCPKCQRWFFGDEPATPRETLTTPIIEREVLCDDCFTAMACEHDELA